MQRDQLDFDVGQLKSTRKRKTKSKPPVINKPDPVARFVADLLRKKKVCMAGFYEIYSATKICLREKI